MTKQVQAVGVPKSTREVDGQGKSPSLINSLASQEQIVVLNALMVVSSLIRSGKKDINDAQLFSALISLAGGEKHRGSRQTSALEILTKNIDKVNSGNLQSLLDVATGNLNHKQGALSDGSAMASISLLNALFEAEYLKEGDEEALATLVDYADDALSSDIEDARQALIDKLLEKSDKEKKS